MFTLWPGALIIAPIFGMIAIGLGPNGLLARMYACWLRLATFSTAVIVSFYLVYEVDFIVNYYVGWLVAGLGCGNLIQLLVIDLYIAHVERVRFTRGWDGLATSLSVTQDVKIDLKY